MKTTLRILYLEDNPLDAELVQATLAAEGIECEVMRVETRAGFLAALDRGGFELILSDCSLPAFDGISALAIAKGKRPEVPFIFVSGSIGEDVAIETLKSGATDYVLKYRLSRLVPSVRRALDEVQKRIEREHLEEQLRHAQKMESIGTLAGGVAHDFNNLLTAIIGNAQLALARVQPAGPMYDHLVEIESAGRRAAELTRQLLIFSRRQKMNPRSIDLNDTIGDFMKMLRRIIGDDVEVEFRKAANLPVFADPTLIEQVMMNLAVNARDAMPGGGHIIIETSNATLDEAYCRDYPSAKPGKYAQITVSDTGMGMDTETQHHIFEPFFTTKGVGKGTGLGLAVVYGIVKEHEGFIEVHSEVGHGTTFKIYLPSHEKPVEEETQEAQPPLRRGSETVLVAEDEELLRKLAKEILAGLGYQVLLSRDGTEAVEMYAANQEQIDLVILDMVMPRMNGREVYEWIRALGSQVPVIFVTGYSAEMAQNKSVGEMDADFIQKPYSIDTFGRKVRDVLDAPALI